MKMILRTWCTVLMVGFATIAFSQETESKKSPEERAEAVTTWMKDKLELTQDQMEPIAQLNLKYAEKVEELKGTSGSKMDKFQSLKTINEEKEKELKELLSDEQFEQYSDKKRELYKRARKSRG